MSNAIFELFAAAEQFLTGQETALVSQINGGPPRPSFIPPRPTDRGVRRHPTLVQNVETLAHAALIARFGAPWFRSVGTERSPGTALLTVSGAVRTPGVLEAACDTTVGAIVDRAGGVDGEPATVLLGGYFGRWVLAERIWNNTIDALSLQSVGASLGTGVLVVATATTCGISETDRVLTFLAGQTAGQCGPCHVGLPAIAETFHKVATGRARPAAIDLLVRWSHDVRGRGACRHPDGAMLFLASAMDVFAADLRHHLKNGSCRFSGQRPLLPIPTTEAGWW